MSAPTSADMRAFAVELRAEADRLQGIVGLAHTVGHGAGIDDRIVALRADADALEDQARQIEAPD